MSTALQLVNRLLVRMRDEQLTTLDTSEDRTADLLVEINGAGQEVLHEFDWSFRERDDGAAFFPRSFTGETITTTFQSEVVTLDSQSNHIFYLCQAASRLWIQDSATFPEKTFKITSVTSSGGLTRLVLDQLWLGASGASSATTWKTFGNEIPLPVTVDRVLSVRDELNSRPLCLIEKESHLDQIAPRIHGHFGLPTHVYVGGQVKNTVTTDSTGLSAGTTLQQAMNTFMQTGRTHTKMLVHPIPDDDCYFQYSYLLRYQDLTAETSEWTGVPREVEDLIVLQAFHRMLTGNQEADVERASVVAIDLARKKAALQAVDQKDPLRRRIPRILGASRGAAVNVGWQSQEVPSP